MFLLLILFFVLTFKNSIFANKNMYLPDKMCLFRTLTNRQLCFVVMRDWIWRMPSLRIDI